MLPACGPAVQGTASCQPGAAGTPCWCFINDAQSCPASAVNPSSLAFSVNRGGAIPPLGTVTELRCRI
jgi:hypothetical protein